MIEAQHMDPGSRNERLYKTLMGMGLFVVPVFADGDQNQIDYFQVSAGVPAYLSIQKIAEGTASGAVAQPVASAEIVRLVRPAQD